MVESNTRWSAAAAFIGPLLLYLATPAAVMNGDGLMYYYIVSRPSWEAKFVPGHLLYCPLMAWVGEAVRPFAPQVSSAEVMLLANQLAGACSVWLLFLTARRLRINPAGQWLTAAGLASSYGFWVQASDVETYAIALMFVVAAIHRMTVYAENGSRTNLILLGVFNGSGALFHLSTVFTVPASLSLIVISKKSQPVEMLKAAALYILAFSLVFWLPVFVVGLIILELPGSLSVLQWLKSSEHGYRVTLDWLSAPRAAYGFIRTFLYLEFFWTASKWILVLKGLGLSAVVLWLAMQCKGLTSGLPKGIRVILGSMLPFVLIQVLLGIFFFGSDTERWVFLAPLVWLTVGAFASRLSPARQAIVGALALTLGILNGVQGILPTVTDTRTRDRVLALDRLMTTGDVVITPGHDWVAYFRYFSPKTVEVVTLIDLALRHKDDHDAFFEHLTTIARQSRACGKEVFLVRILDPADDSRESPWQDIQAFGYRPDDVRRWFAAWPWREAALITGDPARLHQLIHEDSARPSSPQ